MSETQWSHTLHISLNQGKSDDLVSQTEPSGLVSFLQQLVLKFRMFQFPKPDVLVFYWIVLNG
jgi:hypothetical protein